MAKRSILIFAFCALHLLSGCIQKSDLDMAQDYIRKSQNYYEQAINLYKDLITQGKDLDRLHYELGRLYFSHGDFLKAIEQLKKTNELKAKKFLAISYHRLGNFTDALEVFNKTKMSDDEYLYYHGLTCEKLNLFDQALDIYKKIKTEEFVSLGTERINLIEKQVKLVHIKEIDPEVYKILLEAPREQDYPQAGAFILYCDEKIEITSTNNQITHLHYIVKILNERGKEDFSESHIDYDSTFEKVELEYARTIKPDGTVVEVGSRHIRDVSKYLNFPLYSNVRAFILSFPEVTEGAVIEYKAKIYRSQLINKKDFVVSYPVQAAEPVIYAKFTIDLPQDRNLHIKIVNEKYNYFAVDLQPKIKKEDNRLIYNWEFNNVPEILPESNMPPSTEINPTILISTFNEWQEIYNWWWSIVKDKIEADSAIKDEVNRLTKDFTSNEEKIREIYNFCAQKIRYVAVEYGQAGYEPHPASDIFKNKYGDCKDQSILLITMLKEAGYLTWPVLISTKGYYNLNEDFPSIHFNHCIAAVNLEDRIVFLDPTAQTCPFADLPADDQGRQVLVFKDETYQIQSIPLYPAGHNLIRQYINIKINKDETIDAQKTIYSLGVYDQAQRLWLLYTPPELIEQALEEKLESISIGAKLEDYNIKNLHDFDTPVVLSYTFSGPQYLTIAGPLRIMPELASLDTSLVAKDKRKYAIDFDILDTKEIIFEIEIPDNFTIRYIPENISEENSWLKFGVEYNYKDNKIYFKKWMELKKNIIPEEDYAEFKDFFEGLAKKVKQKIVLEKVK